MNGARKPILTLLALVALVALCVTSAPAVPAGAAVAIDPMGAVYGGVATVSGVFTARAGSTVRVKVRVEQYRRGRVVATAVASIGPVVADGSIQNWTATLNPAIFVPGTAFTEGQIQASARLIQMIPNDAITLATSDATVELVVNQ
jgi:hypothetical protein